MTKYSTAEHDSRVVCLSFQWLSCFHSWYWSARCILVLSISLWIHCKASETLWNYSAASPKTLNVSRHFARFSTKAIVNRFPQVSYNVACALEFRWVATSSLLFIEIFSKSFPFGELLMNFNGVVCADEETQLNFNENGSFLTKTGEF